MFLREASKLAVATHSSDRKSGDQERFLASNDALRPALVAVGDRVRRACLRLVPPPLRRLRGACVSVRESGVDLDRAAAALSRPARAPRRDYSLDERPEGMPATSAVRAADATLGRPRRTRWCQHLSLRSSSGTGVRNLVSVLS
jgi:hypothetical protein